MGADASDPLLVAREFRDTPALAPGHHAPRTKKQKKIRKGKLPWAYVPYRYSDRSEASVTIRSIRVPAFLKSALLGDKAWGSGRKLELWPRCHDTPLDDFDDAWSNTMHLHRVRRGKNDRDSAPGEPSEQ